ncbi:MAG: SDR family NAD(P)-dependent oxidoreductase [Muribaculaceae bacterium]|nr:SDR family NAD(P)-dependent oxidoreductase [Muribaculaceae bacterium]
MDAQNQAPVFIVTGATDSTGTIISKRLAAQGKPLIIASYNEQRGIDFVAKLKETTLNQDITFIRLDLNSFAGVQSFCNRVKELNRPVAALINNASYISRHSETSPDGYEKIVQVNFLSTMLLTLQLVPLMPENSHIIFSTSLSRKLVSLPYEFPAVNSFIPPTAYAQSKLALTLMSIYISTVLRTKRIQVNCVNPGIINLGVARMSKWLESFGDYYQMVHDPSNCATAVIRALESADTGFIFKGTDTQVKTTTYLKNREVFIRLCNDTMRLLKKHLQ